MLIYMGGIVLGFFLMAWIGVWGEGVDADGLRTIVPAFDGVWWLIIAVAITIFASVFVQGAEGATFAIIPMVHKTQTGQIAGMAGAYGNVGAVIYLVLFSLVDSRTFFFILAGGALAAFVVTLLMLEEPKDAFAAEYVRDEAGAIE
jgi:NNP family nitrate/nitrite transporter-like MFS transporter